MPTLLAPEPKTVSKSASRTPLWYTRCAVPTTLGVAIQSGLLHDEFADDPEVQILALKQSKEKKVHDSHFTHTLERSFRHGGNIPAIWSKSRGSDLRVIGLSFVLGPQTILTLPGSGIRTPADLKGKRLLIPGKLTREPAWPSYATQLRTYESGLATAGLTLNDVHLVEHKSIRPEHKAGEEAYDVRKPIAQGREGVGRLTDTINPLLAGEVDAVASGSIGIASPRLVDLFGLHVVFDALSLEQRWQRYNNSTPLTFAVSGALIEERPDLVARFLVPVLQAAELAKSHPADAVRYIAREQSTSEDLVETAYGSDLAETLEVDLSPEKIKALHHEKEYLRKLGHLQTDFDVEKWIDPRPLEQARAILAERKKKPGYQASLSHFGRPLAPAPAKGSCSL